MWNCGSARVALIVLVGTGLSTGVSPEGWVTITGVAILFLALESRLTSSCGRWVQRPVRDGLVAVLLLSGVGLSASMRLEGDARESFILEEKVAGIRGTVVGFPSRCEYGTDVALHTLTADTLSAPLPRGTRVLAKVRGRFLAVSPGDTLVLAGLLRSPYGPRNPGGFSEAAYLYQSGTRAILTVPAFIRPVVRRADSPKGFVAIYMAPVHEWVKNGINRHVHGNERAFLLALVLGERGELADEMQDAFRKSGIIHLISVSGLHTGLVAMIAFLFLKGIRFPSKASLVGSALVVWFYCGISGCSPPTLRSSVMVTCVVASRLVGKSTSLVSPLCTSCAILLLVNPRYVWDVGFQLSYAATGAMLAGASLGRALKQWLCPPEWVWKYVLSTVLTTIVAQLGVLPILALQFGYVSVTSIPANLLAIPVASCALVSSFCSLGLLALAPPLADFCFSLTWLLLRLCSLIAQVASSVPGASVELVKPRGGEAAAFLLCFFVFLRRAARLPVKVKSVVRSSTTDSSGSFGVGVLRAAKSKDKLALVAAGAGLVVLVVVFAGGEIPGTKPARKSTEVHFLDVGQGDATAIRLADRRILLVDGGESQENWDSAKRVLIPFARDARKKKFDMVFVTHFHSDHVGGVIRLLEEGRVKRLLVARADTTTALARLARSLARKKGVDIVFVAEHDTIVCGDGVELAVLHPSGSSSADTSFGSINDSSLVIVMRTGMAQFVLTGDTGPRAMDRVADAVRPGRITVLKTPHHGGKGTLSVRFLKRIRPEYAVFSVGRNNRFGHPSRDVVKTYRDSGTKTYRTDIDGCISFEIAGDSLAVRTAHPSTGSSFLQKAKSRRGERKVKLFALLSGTTSLRRLARTLQFTPSHAKRQRVRPDRS